MLPTPVRFALQLALGVGGVLMLCNKPGAAAPVVSPTPKVLMPWSAYGPYKSSYALTAIAPDRNGIHDALGLRAVSQPGPVGFGVAVEALSAESFRGKRLRIQLQVQSDEIGRAAALFARSADATANPESLEGTRVARISAGSWHPAEVVVDVAPNDVVLVIGLVLRGMGHLEAELPQIEVVGSDVALSPLAAGEDAPTGLDFEEDPVPAPAPSRR